MMGESTVYFTIVELKQPIHPSKGNLKKTLQHKCNTAALKPLKIKQPIKLQHNNKIKITDYEENRQKKHT